MRRACLQMAVEARLINLCQRESTLEAGQTVAMERVEWQLPAFTKASQNVAATAALLDILPAPFTNGVGMVYQWLKSILDTARRIASGEFPATLGRCLCFAPCSSQGWLTKVRPRDSGRGNDFLAGRIFNLRSFKLTKHSVGTSSIPMAPPWGRRCIVPASHVIPTSRGPQRS
jgi:hypothetical protein